MFKKVLASVGIGGAKVDTVVLAADVQPGGVLPIEVVIEGGAVSQDISGLNLALMTRIKAEVDDEVVLQNHVLQSWQLAHAFEIAAGDRRVIPMQLEIHPETPLTALACGDNRSTVWLQTGLEIDLALDADDIDPINVVPTPGMMDVLVAAERCGLQLVKTDVESGQVNAPGFRSTLGCYQELEYRPQGWLTSLNEVELTLLPQPGVTHVLAEVDRMMRGDAYIALSFPDGTGVDQVEAQLRQQLGL